MRCCADCNLGSCTQPPIVKVNAPKRGLEAQESGRGGARRLRVRMGMQARSGAVLRVRIARALRHLYPNFVAREARLAPLALLSMAYVLSIVATAVYLVAISLIPALPTHPVRNAILLAIFTWCASMCVVSYILTAWADAGRVPDSWRPRTEDARAAGTPPHPPAVTAASMLAADGAPRYCQKCACFKPDRTHHCSSCARCVLCMDHHCPFTGNACIGFGNRKFFVLFLYYAAAGCALATVLTPVTILGLLEDLGPDVTTWDVLWVILVMFGYMMCFIHALALSGFAAFHTYLVLKNRTTIENNEPRQVLHAEAIRRMDVSAAHHWRAVMGPKPWLWFLPVSLGCEGDGVHWRRVDDLL